MPTLEIRRHSLRKAGVDLARRIGATTGPFDVVATAGCSGPARVRG